MHAPLALVVASLVAAQGPAAGGAPPSVLMLPVEPKNGVTQDAADLASAMLIGRVRRVPGVRIVSYRELEGAMSQAQRRMLVDCDSVSCAAEIAGALNADQIVLGALGKLGGAYILSLSRIEARNARLVASTVRQFPAVSEDAITRELPLAAAELFPEARDSVLDPPRPAPAAVAAPGAPAPEQRIIIEHREPSEGTSSAGLTGAALRTIGGFGTAGSLLVFAAAALGGSTSLVMLGWYVVRFYIPAVLHPTGVATRSAEESQFLFTLGALGSLGLVVALVVGAAAALLALVNLTLVVLGIVVGRLGL